MDKIRVFVSSVQKELENERIAIPELISLDPFLNRHIQPILFERLPASPRPAERAYLKALRSCDIYFGILGFEYGKKGNDGLSATHREYLEAKRFGIPAYFFIKGDGSQDARRVSDLRALFKSIRDEQKGHVYKRFSHYQSLKSCVRAVLLAELEERKLIPTHQEREIAEHTIAQASDFDTRLVDRADEKDLNIDLCVRYVAATTGLPNIEIDGSHIRKVLTNWGLLWYDELSNSFRPTSAGLLLFGKNPSIVYPQVRIAANAYGGAERGEPIDRDDINEPLPLAVERAFQFLQRNMRHTTRIEGFSKIEINEYPYEALREAVVNAVAHRDYDLAGSCIRIEKYVDRVEILSPGLLPEPITLEKIEKLDYIACSRNPNIARGLSYFERIEEQGDGIRRIVRVTTEVGLPRPRFLIRDGHFAVIFFGPGDDILKLKSLDMPPVFKVSDDLLDRLSETQKHILQILIAEKEVRVPDLADRLDLSQQSIRKALKLLRDIGLISRIGKARETFYILDETKAE